MLEPRYIAKGIHCSEETLLKQYPSGIPPFVDKVFLAGEVDATIADLQGQLTLANIDQANGEAERNDLQQRVAQLEGDNAKWEASCNLVEAVMERNKLKTELTTLQADHARVLGLVQALGVVGLPAEHTRPDDFILLKTGEGWMAHTYNYWAKFATEEEARAYIALLEYRASLPAQPAQGGELCTYCKLPLTENHSFSYGFPGVSRVYKCDRPSCVKPNAEGETRA